MAEHVFGYGSLVAGAAGVRCELRGHRRVWGVAMDNAVAIPGYKVYEDASGARPGVCVAFLDIEPGGDGVNGVCLPADEAALAVLDRRERQYERVDVTGLVEGAPPGRVWTYAGRAEGRERLRAARAAGRAAVQRAYVEAVRRAFAALGASALERFEATTIPHGLPVLDLVRRDLPPRAS